MKHYILTRLNCRPRPSCALKQTPAWNEHRFNVFANVTAPSVAGQVVDVTWLIAMYDKTATKYQCVVNRLARNNKNFKFLPIPEGVMPWDAFKQYIKDDKPCGPVITSRLDSDDAIHPYYAKTLQKLAAGCNVPTVLNIRTGYGLNTANGKLFPMTHRSNMFIGLVEQGPKILTVQQDTHVSMARRFPCVQSSDIRGWLILVHDLNQANDIHMLRDRRNGRILKRQDAERIFKLKNLNRVSK